jgi:tRNA/tmRNA/rRNA uracil-C5-methylase (TrmA/RlmC/RlmD family)
VLGDPVRFRERARLAVRGTLDDPRIGLFRSGTHDAVAIARCPIHHPAINRVANALREAVRATGCSLYSDDTRRGSLRYLQVAVERESQRVQVVLVGNARKPAALEPVLAALADELGSELQGLFWNGQPEPTNAILGPHWRKVAGYEALRDTIGAARIFYPPGAFAQSHPVLAERIALEVASRVSDGAQVLELFAGCGPIGLGLAARAGKLVLNERDAHGLRGLELGVRDLPSRARASTEILPGPAQGATHLLAASDVVIVDPPRRGLDAALCDSLARTPPVRLLYVSCGLQSLERDLVRLTESGHLVATELLAFDLFPYTDHVETLTVLERAG